MRTQYNNNQYYQQSSSKGLVFKLIVGILVLVICAGISFYRRSLETVFNVDTVQMSENGSSIVVTFDRSEPWLKQVVDFANKNGAEITDLSFLKVDIEKLGKEVFRYSTKDKNNNRLLEIHTKDNDSPKLGDTLVIDISGVNAVCIKQNSGNYQLIARKNEETGSWERVNWFDSLMYEFENPWLF